MSGKEANALWRGSGMGKREERARVEARRPECERGEKMVATHDFARKEPGGKAENYRLWAPASRDHDGRNGKTWSGRFAIPGGWKERGARPRNGGLKMMARAWWKAVASMSCGRSGSGWSVAGEEGRCVFVP